MSSEPWVSCILPTFDRRWVIPLSLTCFARQDYPNRELIVVDDGSDPVGDLMPDDDRVKYVRLRRRATIGAKRNLAIELARGDVLMQWDDDDWFGPDRIRKQLRPLATGQADICHLEQRWLLDACSNRYWYRLDESHPDVRVGSGTLAMTKAAWSVVGGYLDSSEAEDWELFRRAVGNGARAALVPHEGSYVYVRHGANSYRILVDKGVPPPGWVVRPPPRTMPDSDLAFYESLARRLTGVDGDAAAVAQTRSVTPSPGSRQPLDMAIVHHANQHIITDGYADHEGLSQILDAFGAVLSLHLQYNVPANLHLSGTLIEAIAWHRPAFFAILRELEDRDLLELVGSAYGQNVMPLFSPEHNSRQLSEALPLYERHLGILTEEVQGFWLPERVWDPATLSGLLTDPTLPNGGYAWVLLDDRIRFPLSSEGGDADRRQFDVTVNRWLSEGLSDLSERETTMARLACSPYRLHQPHRSPPLTIVPMFAPFRYWIPPSDASRWTLLAQGLQRLAELDAPLAVFGDDLERTAGIGPWSCANPRASLAAFEAFLAAISNGGLPVGAVKISEHLRRSPPEDASRAEGGTFVELSSGMGAGEDYRAWSQAPDWASARRRLERAGKTVHGRAGGLWELAWKQVLSCSYETGWREWDGSRYRATPWAKAHASHSRSALLIAAAAEWRARRPHASSWIGMHDIDEDGDDELIMANQRIFAVLAPRYGGRLIALFDLDASEGGALVVGNPADNWNLQEELNRFMQQPRSHPGALCDVGFENDRYAVVYGFREADGGTARLRNVEPESQMFGATKALRLVPHGVELETVYSLPPTMETLDVDFALSPDYLTLLRGGRAGLKRLDGRTGHGWVLGDCAVRLTAYPDRREHWREDLNACPHAVLVTYSGHPPMFTITVGLGVGPARKPGDQQRTVPDAVEPSAQLRPRT